MSQDEFESIRPYRDEEIRPVLERLLADPELLDALVTYRLPWLPGALRPLLRAPVSRWLRRRTDRFTSVHSFQVSQKSWFDRMIGTTTDGFTWSGLEQLAPERAYLYVANHRDIAVDSALMNYALHAEERGMSRIAIGDNLVHRSFATDLMRLNKSFIVRRSFRGVREQYAAYQLTSRYIHHSIAEGESVWIAQREGRAKDGWDATDPAILKMFYMSQRKSGRSFGEVLADLHIVPVAMSYEFDPCDAMKAHELAVRARSGEYHKPEGEDLESIVTGITGYKGRVHLHFGPEMTAPSDDPDALAAALDRDIHAGFRLWPTHLEAWRRLGRSVPESLAREVPPLTPALAERFDARLAAVDAAERSWLLLQYANPVAQRLGLEPLTIAPPAPDLTVSPA